MAPPTTPPEPTEAAFSPSEFHPEAQKRISAHAGRFTTAVVECARSCAHHDHADIVLTSHVERAASMLRGNSDERSRAEELALVFGSALFGAFVQGIVTKLSADRVEATLVASYIVMGVVGGFLITTGLRNESSG